MTLSVIDICKACHEVNRGISEVVGDHSQNVDWDLLPQEIQNSLISGVRNIMDHPEITPEENHNHWMEERKAQGWVFGLDKSIPDKVHPFLQPYSNLPLVAKVKNLVFHNLVKSLMSL